MQIQIRTIRDGIESELFTLTKQRHRALLVDKPDKVVVLIDYIYPGSPDCGTFVTLDFKHFNIISREKILEENKFLKREERHGIEVSIEEIDPLSNHALYSTAEDDFFKKEQSEALKRGKTTLTPTQLNRVEAIVDDCLSYHECARREGKRWESIAESFRASKEKLKKFL
ncbi:hypothetical protein [Oscillibacter sp.]|uniref:hypothetical protein n=1 Tax=Oscillibacter sp. TaxID=1945593 RepID=UPI0028A1FC92|nr:hypothetical protein [Oscillibacter sp.]